MACIQGKKYVIFSRVFFCRDMIYVLVLYNHFLFSFMLFLSCYRYAECRPQEDQVITVFFSCCNKNHGNVMMSSVTIQSLFIRSHLTAGLILLAVFVSCQQPMDAVSHSQCRHTVYQHRHTPGSYACLCVCVFSRNLNK